MKSWLKIDLKPALSLYPLSDSRTYTMDGFWEFRGQGMFFELGDVPFFIRTPPKDDGFMNKGVRIFSSKKPTKFGPFAQTFQSAAKNKPFGLHFSQDADKNRGVSDPSHP